MSEKIHDFGETGGDSALILEDILQEALQKRAKKAAESDGVVSPRPLGKPQVEENAAAEPVGLPVEKKPLPDSETVVSRRFHRPDMTEQRSTRSRTPLVSDIMLEIEETKKAGKDPSQDRKASVETVPPVGADLSLDEFDNDVKVYSPGEDTSADDMAAEADVKVYVPKAASPEANMDRTRVAAIAGAHTSVADRKKAVVIEDEPEALEQLNLESLFGQAESPEYEDVFSYSHLDTADDSSEADDSPVSDERISEERRRRAEEFRPDFNLNEQNDGDEDSDGRLPEEIDDYNSYDEAPAVRAELVSRLRVGRMRMMASGIITTLLFLVFFGAGVFDLAILSSGVYVTLTAVLLIAQLAVHYQIIIDGIISLVRLQGSAEGGAAAAGVVAVVHTLVQFADLSAIHESGAVLFAPAAAAGLFLCACGQYLREMHIKGNFEFVSNRSQKYAAVLIDDPQCAREIGQSTVDIGEPEIGYCRPASFLTRFLEMSYQDTDTLAAFGRFVPLMIGFSAVAAIIYALLSSGDLWRNSLSVFSACVCFSLPTMTAVAMNVPLLRAAARLRSRGGMLVGWQAVAQFGGTHALAADALEIFPGNSVRLHEIKTFSGARIDESILDAAAVSIASGGPLSSIFRRVIQDRTDLLGDVDTLVYEQDMGMSGWVGGRRVLIGNRLLLQNHGVDVPSGDYEQRYTQNGRKTVYLSTAGELCAMFVVSYTADPTIADALEQMTGAGVTLLVRTCDPNITEELICDVYGLKSYYVEVMGAAGGRRYESLISAYEVCPHSDVQAEGDAESGDSEQPQYDAVLASDGRLEGMATGFALCRRLRGVARLSVLIQVLGSLVGLAIAVFLCLGTSSLPSPIFMTMYVVLWTVVSVAVPSVVRRV